MVVLGGGAGSYEQGTPEQEVVLAPPLLQVKYCTKERYSYLTDRGEGWKVEDGSVSILVKDEKNPSFTLLSPARLRAAPGA